MLTSGFALTKVTQRRSAVNYRRFEKT